MFCLIKKGECRFRDGDDEITIEIGLWRGLMNRVITIYIEPIYNSRSHTK